MATPLFTRGELSRLLVAFDEHITASSLGFVIYGHEMHQIAQAAGLIGPGDQSATRWTGELVQMGYATHGPLSAGDPRPLPRGGWTDFDLQRVSDYRITYEGRSEADRVRRQRREALTEAALGVASRALLTPSAGSSGEPSRRHSHTCGPRSITSSRFPRSAPPRTSSRPPARSALPPLAEPFPRERRCRGSSRRLCGSRDSMILRTSWLAASRQRSSASMSCAMFSALVRWWHSKQLRIDESTVSDYQWRLGYLQRFFGRYRLSEITAQLVDRFRDELHEQAETIRTAQMRAATKKNARPLMDTVTDKRGRTYQRRRRPLSNTSINAMIKLLCQILQQAVDYGMIDRNPVRVGERSARFLPRVRPRRTFLEIDEFHALLDAAGELEAEARADRKGLGRRAMIAALGLAGFRISEMIDLRGGTVDLARSRFKLPDAKTEAGVREVEMTLYLRDELVAYLIDRRKRGLPCGPKDYFFGTVGGKRRDPDRFRDRILGRAVERANANRAQSGLPELTEITPHSMRRTWATFAAMVGRDPKWIAAQIGHTDPEFTFSVYQQIATRRFIDEQAVWAVMRCADEPAQRITSRQVTRVTRVTRDDPRGSHSVNQFSAEKGEFDQFLADLNDPTMDWNDEATSG